MMNDDDDEMMRGSRSFSSVGKKKECDIKRVPFLLFHLFFCVVHFDGRPRRVRHSNLWK
jgi:hypothetical protein